MNEEEIFQVAAAMPPAERKAYLCTACEGQPVLRERLKRLLASHEHGGFMRRPADNADSAELPAELTPLKPEEGEDRIGNYRLLQQIGEGGFGSVWMAEQLEPVRRRVALKIIKLGMDTKEVIVRFEQERQALALMDHPNIAKVFDAGVSPLGRPFFVMELVRGIRITDFCDQNNLPTKERLDLFIAVCNAIQHAHQKGIIHRDIKPSNILVTLHDGVPVPKVIDFGVAKAIQSERLTELTFFTRFDQMIGTPLYMSPEQAGMSGLDIDTRSDIYSLGVLLYELLTGKTPFDAKELMALGIDAMRKTIRETEPVRPSTRLTQALIAANVIPPGSSPEFAIPSEGEVSADLRRRRLKEQINRLRGDLDWIVMKCLEKDRSRRYETANGLAADLNRHLNNHAVTARPPSAAYKLQKAWRRNKLVFTAVGAVGTALVVGIGVSTWQAFEASRARDAEEKQRLAAQTERDKARRAQTETEQYLYIANMNLAGRAWEQGNFGQLVKLLEETRTFPGRGFEWYYWKRQAHLNLQALRGHMGVVKSVAFSPDGQRIVTGSEDKNARVWDAASGRVLFNLIGHTGAVQSVAISPDGQRIVTGCADHTAKVWDVATQRMLVTLKGHTNRISSVSCSPDGQRILTGSADQTARLWDANSGGELHILPGHGWDVLSVAFSPDGDRVVTGYMDRTARFWETATGRELTPTLSGSGPVSSVAFSPDGKLVVTGSWDSTVTVWDALNGAKLLRLLGHSRGVYSVAFSRDGKKIATAGDETAKIWDASSDRESLALQGKAQGALAVAISADGRRIVTGGTFQVDGSDIEPGGQSAEVWDAASGKQLTTLTGHSSGISSAAFSPDGLWIVTGSRDQTAKVWETDTGKESFPLEGHKGSVNSVAFSPDGKRIVTGGQDHAAKVWDVTSRQVIFQLIGHADAVTSVGFSRDGTRIVTGSLDNTARVWEAADGRELHKLQSPLITQILSVAFSPDGERVVGGGYGSLVWKVASGDVICQLIGDNTSVSSVAFSPDGRRIATGSYGGNARVWEAITGRELLTLSAYGRVGMSVAFSRDGLRIITGSINSPARVWQAARPDEVAAWDAEELAAEDAEAARREELALPLRKQGDAEKRH